MLIKAAQPLPTQGANYCLPVVLVLTFSVYPVIVCVYLWKGWYQGDMRNGMSYEG